MDLPPSAAPLRALPEASLPRRVRERLHAWPTADGEVSAYLYDPQRAARAAAALRAGLPPWAEVCFAVKANSFPPVLDALLRGSDGGGVDGFEVASAREIALAVASSERVTPGRRARLVASGPGKSTTLLTALVAAEVDVINVESPGELRRLEAVAARAGRRVGVALRVNPARVGLAGSLRMGGRASAFGIPESEVPAAVDLAASLPHLDVLGFHVHAVSGNLDAAAHLAYVGWCLDFAGRTAAATGVDLRVIDVGGGFGVPFEPDRRGERPFDLAMFGDGLSRMRMPAGVRMVFEPGRLLAADCGWYAAEVIDVKRSYGTDFVIVRGGIHHFALPISWEIVHNFAIVTRPGTDPPDPAPERPVTVVGELCTPEDTLARDVTVGLVRPGDVVVFPMAGAYGYEFALGDFLGHPRPARIVLDSASAPAPGTRSALRRDR